jgi:chemotaxis protein CheZ
LQRKIFRIEQMAPHARTTSRILGAEDASLPASSSAAAHQLVQGRSRLADVARDLGMLLRDGRESRMARTAGELGAAVEAMEKATDRIIRSAEMIDDCAKALAAARITTYEHGLAQEIQEHVTRLYEACNFQDLAGQRIGKVIDMLAMVERELQRVIAGCDVEIPSLDVDRRAEAINLLNGPRLDGESGHATQHQIDAIFD